VNVNVMCVPQNNKVYASMNMWNYVAYCYEIWDKGTTK